MLQVSLQEIKLKLLEERVLLKNINFTLPGNCIYTILGKNGSGKSTLLKAIPKLLDERFYTIKGEIFFNGQDIFTLSTEELLKLRKNKIKYVLQDAVNSFDHLKKLKYYFSSVYSPGKVKEDEVKELLEYFLLPGMEKLFKLYPYEISGGMAQRVNFVLALLSKPDVILLDEPTSGIDNAIGNLFLLKLKEYVSTGNHSAILITHDLKFAEKSADKTALLSNGNLSPFLSPPEFFSRYDEQLKEISNKVIYES